MCVWPICYTCYTDYALVQIVRLEVLRGTLRLCTLWISATVRHDGLQESGRDGLLPAGPVLGEVSAISHLVRGGDRHWLQVSLCTHVCVRAPSEISSYKGSPQA